MSSTEKSATEQIDDIISNTHGWRGDTLAKLREVVMQADTEIIEEVKWKKPSKPEGIPVWTYNGKNVCMADTLKNAVRLTFPGGAQVHDPDGLFNTRLDSKTVRAIDFFEGSSIDSDRLQKIVVDATRL